MEFVPPGVFRIDHLKEPWPWTGGLVGLVKWLTWETENVLGISKTELRRRIVSETVRLYASGVQDPDEISAQIDKLFQKEVKEAAASGAFDPPAKYSLLGAVELQRRLRVFAEDYLNKEVDVFLSLLPDRLLTGYLTAFFPTLRPDATWSVYGNSNEIELSFDMYFMQIDTMAYSHNAAVLAGVEQKVDAPIGAAQVVKYGFLTAHLEDIGKIASDSRLDLLFVEAVRTTVPDDTELRRHALSLLDQKDYPKNRLSPERAGRLAPRVRQILTDAGLSRTTWQQFGEHFASVQETLPANQETVRKLINGFLTSLRLKWSKKNRVQLYSGAMRP